LELELEDRLEIRRERRSGEAAEDRELDRPKEEKIEDRRRPSSSAGGEVGGLEGAREVLGAATVESARLIVAPKPICPSSPPDESSGVSGSTSLFVCTGCTFFFDILRGGSLGAVSPGNNAVGSFAGELFMPPLLLQLGRRSIVEFNFLFSFSASRSMSVVELRAEERRRIQPGREDCVWGFWEASR
jgi:hypothetical protein